jgi:hypothetical protein
VRSGVIGTVPESRRNDNRIIIKNSNECVTRENRHATLSYPDQRPGRGQATYSEYIEAGKWKEYVPPPLPER